MQRDIVRLAACGAVWLVGAALARTEAPPVPEIAGRLEPIMFAVIGDFGLDTWKPKTNPADPTKPEARRNPHQAAVADLVAGWKPDFVITVGDNNYPKGEAVTIDANIGKYYQAFIGNYRGRYGPGSPDNRFFPVLGNHDWDAPGGRCQPYIDYFTLPGNERYYDFVWGPVHFVMLDTDGREPDGARIGSKQYAWYLERVKASASPFQVVVGHHPPFSSGDHGDTEGSDWKFHEHGVDLLLCGHDHNYERIERDGMTYIVNGAGGGSLRRSRNPQRDDSKVFSIKKHGAQRIEVGPVEGKPGTWRLTSRFIDVAGDEIDAFSIESAAP